MSVNPDLYREVSCVVLGTLIGALISVPLTAQMSGFAGMVVPLLIVLIGGLIGYRRRRSAAFFYFCILASLALSWLIFTQSEAPPR